MGKTFRVRPNRKNAAPIRSGESSGSNAPVTTFRERARAERAADRAPMIAIDDRLEADVSQVVHVGDLNLEDDNASMVSAKSDAKSVLTNFTNCTNPTFDPVHRIWNSGSVIHEDAISVLASAADVIRAKAGAQNDVEYYGVLLVTLETIDVEDIKKVGATSYLLQLVMPKIRSQVLIKTFPNCKKAIADKLTALASKPQSSAAIKLLLCAYGCLLKAQPIAFWKSPENRAILADFVPYAIHAHAGVRTVSRRIIRAILTEERYLRNDEYHPAAKGVTQTFCVILEANKTSTDAVTRLLCLLEGILHKMPPATFTSLVETLLDLAATSLDTITRCAAFQCMCKALTKPPSEVVFPVDKRAELILALQTHHIPSDISVFAYWMQCLCEAHNCLSVVQRADSVKLLDATLALFGKAFTTPSLELGHAVTLSLEQLIERTVANPREDVSGSLASVKDESDEVVFSRAGAEMCLAMLDGSLASHNPKSWEFVLKSMAVLFEHAKRNVLGESFKKVIVTLVNLREQDGCVIAKSIDNVIGSAVRHVGLSNILPEVVDFGFDPTAQTLPTDFKRSWFVCLLAKFVKNETIEFFLSKLVPFNKALHSRIASLPPMTAKLFHVFELQVWDVLPPLLLTATDFVKNFSSIAPLIGSALTSRLDLRLMLLKAVRNSLRHAEFDDVPEVVAQFAKNYLPILFNVYTASSAETMKVVQDQGITNYDDRHTKLSTLETIRAYVKVTPDDTKKYCVDVALAKISSQDQSAEKKQAISDITVALIQGLEVEEFAKIFESIQLWFASKQPAFQKKAYRILESMYQRINEPGLRPFFEENAQYVTGLIEKGMEGVHPAARGPRLGIYRSILTSFNDFDDVVHFTGQILEQVIASQDKSFPKATRHHAGHCFVEICEALVSNAADNDVSASDALESVFGTIARLYVSSIGDEADDGLGQSALISLNMLVQKYVKAFSLSLLNKAIDLTCSTLHDERATIQLYANRCMRIMCNKLDEVVMTQFKSMILKCVFEQKLNTATFRVRKAIRLLLQVLVERYGHELLLTMTQDENFIKQMRNIAKIQRRKERSKQAGGDASATTAADDDDDGDDEGMSLYTTADTVKADTIFDILEDTDDEEEEAAGEEKKIKKTVDSGSVFMTEGEDDIVDFLDRQAVIQKLSTAKPTPAKRVTIEEPVKQDTFKVTKDGKIVIVNIDRKRSRHNSEMFDTTKDDGADDDDDVADADDEMSVDQSSAVTSSQYRPGGSGIHRRLGPSSSRSGVGGPSSSKAASFVSNLTSPGGKKSKKRAGDKMEPFAYIPLRNTDRRSGLKKILKKTKPGKQSRHSK